MPLIGLLMLLAGVLTADAVNVTAFVYNTFDLIGSDGYLPIGSYVQIVGTTTPGAPVNNIGSNGCSDCRYLPAGDVLVYDFYIDEEGWWNTFSVGFNSDDVDYLYIRFYDYQNGIPIGDEIAWGMSALVDVTGFDPFFPFIDVDFAPDTDLIVGQTNCFAIIPEPGSGSLLLAALGVGAAVFGATRRPRRPDKGLLSEADGER